MNGVWVMSDVGGWYVRIVRCFECWIDCVNEIEEVCRSGMVLI